MCRYTISDCPCDGHRQAVVNTVPGDGSGEDPGTLRCPYCAEPNVHLDQVAISPERGSAVDPHETTLRVDANQDKVVSPGEFPTSEGLLYRGHGIALSGYCEMCGEEFALVFGQHKGATRIGWVRR